MLTGGQKKRSTNGKSSHNPGPLRQMSAYAVGSVCSVSAWLYAGQIFLLHELIRIPTANTTAKMITALFMANRFKS